MNISLDTSTDRRCPCDRFDASARPAPGGCVGRPGPGQVDLPAPAARTAL
ncbi:hypothetical protein [Cryptosporangium minutisporangium]